MKGPLQRMGAAELRIWLRLAILFLLPTACALVLVGLLDPGAALHLGDTLPAGGTGASGAIPGAPPPPGAVEAGTAAPEPLRIARAAVTVLLLAGAGEILPRALSPRRFVDGLTALWLGILFAQLFVTDRGLPYEVLIPALLIGTGLAVALHLLRRRR